MLNTCCFVCWGGIAARGAGPQAESAIRDLLNGKGHICSMSKKVELINVCLSLSGLQMGASQFPPKLNLHI